MERGLRVERQDEKGVRVSVNAFNHVLKSTAKLSMAVTTQPMRTPAPAAADAGFTTMTRGSPWFATGMPKGLSTTLTRHLPATSLRGSLASRGSTTSWDGGMACSASAAMREGPWNALRARLSCRWPGPTMWHSSTSRAPPHLATLHNEQVGRLARGRTAAAAPGGPPSSDLASSSASRLLTESQRSRSERGRMLAIT